MTENTDHRRRPRRTNASPIAKARLEKGMTQRELAAAIGCGTTQIANWETGVRHPKLDALIRIAEVLDVDPMTLR